MTDNIIDLAERRRQRNRPPRYTLNPTWPLAIIGCLTFWVWFISTVAAIFRT